MLEGAKCCRTRNERKSIRKHAVEGGWEGQGQTLSIIGSEVYQLLHNRLPQKSAT